MTLNAVKVATDVSRGGGVEGMRDKSDGIPTAGMPDVQISPQMHHKWAWGEAEVATMHKRAEVVVLGDVKR